jgi:RecA-family ATPase
MIIFDSLIAFAGSNENSAAEMRHHMSLYRRLTALGATILVIHHRREKDESAYRGSSDIRAAVDAAGDSPGMTAQVPVTLSAA